MSWSPKNTRFLRRNWSKMTATEIGEKIGKSESAVRGKAYRLGLRRSD